MCGSRTRLGALSIPAGVRDVVGRRLSHLSRDANRLLAAGALFEVSFPLSIAAAVTDIGEDEALDAIDEALEARIVAPTDEFDRYAFTHALFRHTLVEELNPSRQVRMHRAIAEAIEKELRGAPDPGTAATLARHYLRSAGAPGRGTGRSRTRSPSPTTRPDGTPATKSSPRCSLALELLEQHDERTTLLHRRVAMAAVLAQIDDVDQLAAAETAVELIAEEDGDDAACDFVVELLMSARSLDVVEMAWRLAAIARPATATRTPRSDVGLRAVRRAVGAELPRSARARAYPSTMTTTASFEPFWQRCRLRTTSSSRCTTARRRVRRRRCR